MKFGPICSKLLFYFIFISACTSYTEALSETDFIEVYARLTIINELKTNKVHHDKLVEELLEEFNIQVSDIQKTVHIYQNNPREWLQILEKVKDKINEIREKDSVNPRT